jgi:peptide chain release factor 1
VTDHRIGLTLHNLTSVLDGDIGELLEGLRLAADEERMSS